MADKKCNKEPVWEVSIRIESLRTGKALVRELTSCDDCFDDAVAARDIEIMFQEGRNLLRSREEPVRSRDEPETKKVTN